MLAFLNNSEVVNFVSISLSLIGIWLSLLALRKPVQLPAYEALAIEPIDTSKEDVKEILEKVPKLSGDMDVIFPCYVTFRIWNAGGESISLPKKSNPLIIAFKKETRILDCQKLETEPNNLKISYTVDAEKILVVVPLLKPKEYFIMKVLVTDYVYYFPDIPAPRIPEDIRIVRANNVRDSREMRILALFFLGGAIYTGLDFFFGSHSKSGEATSFYFFFGLGCLVASTLCFLQSLVERKMPPFNYIPPSAFLFALVILLVCALLFLVPVGLVAVIIYKAFGAEGLRLLFIGALFLVTPFGLWSMIYTIITTWLRKRQKAYNALFIGSLTGIIPLAFLGLCIYTFVTMLLFA